MKSIKFCKFHGFGNDYAVIEASELEAVADLGEFARRFCHRHTGVGADGLAVIEKKSAADAADYSCRIINPDGSEAGFSGNGTRCAVAYLYESRLWRDPKLRLETKSGVKTYEFLRREHWTYWFLAELGKPRFDLPPTFAREQTFENEETKEFGLLIPSEETAVRITYVDVGNPVAVIFLEDFGAVNWRRFGSRIETAPLFPERTNVVFVKVTDARNIEIRIWERGAGETASSGTCSIAAAVASAHTGRTGREVAVHAEGGTTDAVWRAEDDEMMITGRADFVFRGEYLAEN